MILNKWLQVEIQNFYAIVFQYDWNAIKFSARR